MYFWCKYSVWLALSMLSLSSSAIIICISVSENSLFVAPASFSVLLSWYVCCCSSDRICAVVCMIFLSCTWKIICVMLLLVFLYSAVTVISLFSFISFIATAITFLLKSLVALYFLVHSSFSFSSDISTFILFLFFSAVSHFNIS